MLVDRASVYGFKFYHFAAQILAECGVSGVYLLPAKLKLLDSQGIRRRRSI